jgi:hydrophobe/amphiphile efflux-3 (HAE3) family protein
MGTAARRPLAVGLAVGLLAVAGGLLALRLTPTAATDTLVGKGTPSYQATQRFHDRFGDDAVYVLVREPVAKLTLTSDILRMIGLEGCLSGNAPAGQVPPGGAHGPCARLAATKPVKVVFGPGTFLNTAVGQIADEFNAEKQRSAAQADSAANAARQLAKAKGMSKAQQDKVAQQARSLVQNEFAKTVIQLALKYGLRSTPQLNDPSFVSRIVFDDSKPPGTPKDRFAYIFPNKDNALVQVRLRSDLTERERADAIRQIRRAVAMPEWRLPNGKGTYAVTGAPVVVNDLTSSITGSVARLLIAALVIMALTLGVVFRSRRRLLPLFVALAAAGLTFGGLSLAGASLTMASIGVLPVLIGLAVDYAIQLQSRVEEEGGDGPAAVARTAVRGAPTVATAAAASAAGFLVLLLSPVPMVRGFGVLLVAGIALAFGCAITLGVAALVATRRPGARPAPAAVRGAGELIADNRAARRLRAAATAAGGGALAAATARPGRVLAAALGVAVLGWGLDTQTHVESDIQKLVPQNLPALSDLQALQKSTGVGGELDVVVDGDLTDPAVVSWMASYQKDILARYRYSARRGCGKAEVCPAFSLPDLLGSSSARASRKQIQALLDAVPPYFSQGVITGDHRTATLAFGIRLMPLDRQQRVIEEMRRRLHPPPGVRAELAGLPVLAAEANARVSSPWRRMVTLLAGLLAVGLVLLAAFRRWERALVPLVPIALATGWSALVLFLLRIPLNPMSVTLGALVIAISTEFSVLLSERFRSERSAGHEPREALARTYRSTGAAVLASGTTAIAGFAVLMVSDIRMLRDFGFVTVVDLTVSLAGVMVVLPAVLVLAERRGLLGAGARAGRPRLRLPRRRGRVERAPAA